MKIPESPSYLKLESESAADLDASFSGAVLGPQEARAGAGMRRAGQKMEKQDKGRRKHNPVQGGRRSQWEPKVKKAGLWAERTRLSIKTRHSSKSLDIC